MAASKKRKVGPVAPGNQESGDNSDLSEDEISDEDIALDLEAFSPNDSDFHGIKQLLQQLFLKAHIDLSEMANLLIAQTGVSLVLKNADYTDESDDDSDEDHERYVFGVSSIVNLVLKKDADCVKDLKTYLFAKCSEVCSAEDHLRFKALLEDDENHIGYIINERLINIPGKVSIPIFTTLLKDMQVADLNNTVKKYNFSNYLMISKTYVEKTSPAGSNSTVTFTNAEEELIVEYATFKFEFSVTEEKDTGLSGSWDDEDMEYEPRRSVMIFPADKMGVIVERLKSQFAMD